MPSPLRERCIVAQSMRKKDAAALRLKGFFTASI